MRKFERSPVSAEMATGSPNPSRVASASTSPTPARTAGCQEHALWGSCLLHPEFRHAGGSRRRQRGSAATPRPLTFLNRCLNQIPRNRNSSKDRQQQCPLPDAPAMPDEPRRSHLLAASSTGVSTVRRSHSASAESSDPTPTLYAITGRSLSSSSSDIANSAVNLR